MHSDSHTNHSFRPIDEAAKDHKDGLQELLRPLKEKLELFNDIKANFDRTAQDIEVQAQDTERQIKDVFLMLQKFLRKEEEVRIGAVREEKKHKSQMMKRKIEALSREIADLSDKIRATEEVLKATDLFFLQNYKTATEVVQFSLLEVPEPIPALIDMAKHLNNLSFAVLGSMKAMISTEVLDPKTNPEPLRYCPKTTLRSEAVSEWKFSHAQPVRSRKRLVKESGPGLSD